MRGLSRLAIVTVVAIALWACAETGSNGAGDGASVEGSLAHSIYTKIMERRTDYEDLETNKKTLAACINWQATGKNNADVRYSYVYYESEFTERKFSTSQLMEGAINGCQSGKKEHNLDCDCVAVDRNGSPVLRVPKSVSAGTTPTESGDTTVSKPAQTNQIAARDSFQKGWELYLRFNAEDNAKAIPHLETAVELDPEYGRAYAALSLAYRRAGDFSWSAPLGMDNEAAWQVAYRHLQQARKYPTALVHVFLSLKHLWYGRQEEAFDEAARAISLDPNEPEAQIVMSWVMITDGKPDEGLNFVDAAMRLNPNYPSHYVMARGMAYFTKGDFELAASEFGARLEQDPQAIELAPLLASSYALLDRREEARAALQSWQPTTSQLQLSNIPNSYYFPFRGYEHRVVRERLIDGMHIAALPLEVTVPSLVETLQGDDLFPRLSAIQTLGRFGPMAEPAVPALIAALKDEFEDVREEAAIALGKIGPAANDAIPALEVLQEEALQEEALIDFYIKEAIRRITGD